jgi:hypothetical protein
MSRHARPARPKSLPYRADSHAVQSPRRLRPPSISNSQVLLLLFTVIKPDKSDRYRHFTVCQGIAVYSAKLLGIAVMVVVIAIRSEFPTLGCVEGLLGFSTILCF